MKSALFLIAALVMSLSALAQDMTSYHLPAVKMAGVDQAMMLAVDHAGKRIVAVGEHGIILLSDDGGKSFRQAEQVPSRATLTSVSFINSSEGWVAGHWGVILHTLNGGESWTMQREELTVDRPLFCIRFRDALHGIAGGLWSLLLRTDDGGQTWSTVELPMADGRKAEKNLFSLFAGPENDVFITAERGAVYRSADFGKSWEERATGNAGSFWTGITLNNKVLLIAGLRGKIYRSIDDGKSWSAVESGTKSSITALAGLSDGSVIAAGLDGVTLKSTDQGLTFTLTTREDQLANTAVVGAGPGEALTFTASGVAYPPK